MIRYRLAAALALLATSAAADTTPARLFRNGVALSNSQNGYIEDSSRFVAPYIVDGGIRSLRVPLKSKYLVVNGAVADTIQLNGYPTKEKAALKAVIDLALSHNVTVYLDDHEYRWYSDKEVGDFWLPVGKWLMATYGYNANIVLELQNESGGSKWDPNYARSVKDLVTKLRAAGITYKLAIGWADWNNVGSATRAFTDLDAIGGPQSIDSLNRVIWTGHFYQTTTGNDQAKAGWKAPQIQGSTVSSSFATFFDACKIRHLACAVTEIGMGGGAHGWLANGSGKPAFDGKAWLAAYSALTDKYKGTLVGTIAWGGGAAWNDAYPFKVEYAKDAWRKTRETEFWAAMKRFWAK